MFNLVVIGLENNLLIFSFFLVLIFLIRILLVWKFKNVGSELSDSWKLVLMLFLCKCVLSLSLLIFLLLKLILIWLFSDVSGFSKEKVVLLIVILFCFFVVCSFIVWIDSSLFFILIGFLMCNC